MLSCSEAAPITRKEQPHSTIVGVRLASVVRNLVESKPLIGEAGDLLKRLLQEAVQQVLEAEMTETLVLAHRLERNRTADGGAVDPTRC